VSLAEQVAELDWYHVIDLPGAITTPGWFDTRAVAPKVPMPASLAGRRCLDVGTWDGFWAFEMERRGAAAVVAIDLDEPTQWDWPPEARLRHSHNLVYLEQFKRGDAAFRLAHDALGSRAERLPLSVYDLSAEAIGTFDFAFLGTLLMHLRDPVRALDALRGVIAPGGEAVIADSIEAIPTLLRPRTPSARLEALDEPWWWQPNRAGLLQMLRSAGWEIVQATGMYLLPLGPEHPRPAFSLGMARAALSARGRERLITRFLGVPHVAARVRPA
jgi:tRNA (mo5U34)-methyltransferase